MAEEVVVESGSPEGAAPEASKQTVTPESKAQTPSPDPAQGTKGGDAWDKERKGFLADLAKERRARQDYERKVATYESELASERKRVAALAGVNPLSTEEAEQAEIRKRLSQVANKDYLLEQLGLTADDLEGFKSSRQEQSRLAEMEQHYWGRHGQAMVGKVADVIAKELGDLTPRQIDKLTQAYVIRAQQDPEFLQRHEQGDEKLVTEFAQEWLEDWYEPAKRRATAAQVNQFRRVPSGKDRSIVNQGEKKIDVNNNDEVMDLLVKGRTFTGGRR